MFSDRTKYRILEVIPGALVWTTFIAAIALSFLKPLWVVYFIIVFCVYWLFRAFYFIFYLIVSWRRFRRDTKIDWLAKLRKDISDWEKYYHLIFLPTYNEPIDVLKATFLSLLQSKYPKNKMIVVLAGEERAKDHFLKNSEIIKKEFGDKFFKLLITLHPDGVVGEIKAKGANAHYAGKKAKELIDELKIPYENIIVSYFDCDTCVHPQYFTCLTYKYATHPKRTRCAFQPVALYNNNIWDSMALMRVAAFGTTFWLLTELSKPDRLFTFSSHSIAFKALVDVDFWQKDVVSDDSRIFLQCFLRYGGDFRVVPIYIPVSMDTVMADTAWKSLVNLYKQQRRWAWGVEHFPFMVWHFSRSTLKIEDNEIKVPKIPFIKKIKYLWNTSEGMYSWATTPILIFILSRLPFWVGKEKIGETALFQNAPIILQILLTASMLGMFVCAILFLFLLPPRPSNQKPYKIIIMILQWILLPVTLILFGSIPATEAQTRLMLGKYLGFWVTEKARKTKS
jgi:cellulose synthase/poly-beta-1,6-N-acetylglucosamine synthase-like glycosyltransferase